MKSLTNLQKHLTVMASGELTESDLSIKSMDEVGHAGVAFNKMKQNLMGIISKVKGSTSELETAAFSAQQLLLLSSERLPVFLFQEYRTACRLCLEAGSRSRDCLNTYKCLRRIPIRISRMHRGVRLNCR